MKTTRNTLLLWLAYGAILSFMASARAQQRTYCNPINIDYTYMIYNSYKDMSYRSGADPAVVKFRNAYYMFVTRSMGYWRSTDLNHWEFIVPEKWYFQGSNAPAAFNYRDSLLYVAGDPSGQMSILYTDNPKKGDWKATPGILTRLQDPALFIDDNDEAFVYWGSSNKFPIRAKKLEMADRFKPSEETYELFNLKPDEHGWERFGENHRDTILSGYIEGPWMTKHKDTYYLQYGAPGTEFDVYADGVYTSSSPLGPFEYAAHNPFSYKPGGFINGAGHGSTVVGPWETYWHFASMAVNVTVGWERRIGMFPTFFDKDGTMHSNTRFGDYPHHAPSVPHKNGSFTGWMLLSYKKPVSTSSALKGHEASNLVDEDVQTFWVAESNKKGEQVEIDLLRPSLVKAIQVNYNDYNSNLYGKIEGLHHRYLIEGSLDGQRWMPLVDQRNNFKDVPNDYNEVHGKEKIRYIRYTNYHVPTPHLSVSDIRVFGLGSGKSPKAVKKGNIVRGKDRRTAMVSWDPVPKADGYNVLWGIAPDKLYSSWMVYGDNALDLRSLNTDQSYYFTIEAFNENGVSETSEVIKVK
ncbi:family 43 glycosylhydrolase [Maribacter sp. 2307ULW6-5]|uniref:family 43 glycosylhydrolase n=1 Tax=Maribacter sp. 2307ULW6-5 TaxID=3386275 RepID=UPI0039BD4463